MSITIIALKALAILLVFTSCSNPVAVKKVSGRVDLIVQDKAGAAQVSSYIASFPSKEDLLSHQKSVETMGATTQFLADGRSLTVTGPKSLLETFEISNEAMIVNNALVRIVPSKQTEDRQPETIPSPNDLAQELLTVRKVTGVDALRMRRPDATGKGVTVAVFDTGIDFGVKGLSEANREKLRGFYDMTRFGLVKTSPVSIVEGTDQNILKIQLSSGEFLSLSTKLSVGKVVAGGVLSEEKLAQEYLTPTVDIDANEIDTDQFIFVVGEDAKGQKTVWIDLDHNLTIEDEGLEVLNDFNSTKDHLEILQSAGTDGALPLAVTILDFDKVQFHRVIEGHGTSCALIIAGDGFAGGKLQGMAPEASLLSYTLDATGQDVYTVSEFMDMFIHARDHGADIISISWGFTSSDLNSMVFFADWLDREIAAQGVSIVIAAGNAGPGIASGYSTAYMPKNGFSVGAMLSADQARNVYGWQGPLENTVVWYSSIGPSANNRQSPDIISPIISLVRGERNSGTGLFYGFSGTSSATPALAGSLAALISVVKNEGQSKVDTRLLKTAILSTASRIESVEGIRQGSGLIDVNLALDKYINLSLEMAKVNAGESQSFAYDLVAKTPLSDRAGSGEGIHLTGLDRAGAIVEVSLSKESLSKVDRFAFAEPVLISHKKDFFETAEVLTLQASSAKLSLRFLEHKLKKPGMYTDLLEIRRLSDNTLLKQLPVVIEIPEILDSVSPSVKIDIAELQPFGLQRLPIELSQTSRIQLQGIVQQDFFGSGELLGAYLYSKSGEELLSQLLPLKSSGATVIDIKSEKLPAGRYELILFRHFSRGAIFNGPLDVALNLSIFGAANEALRMLSMENGKVSVLLNSSKVPVFNSARLSVGSILHQVVLTRSQDPLRGEVFSGELAGEFAKGEISLGLQQSTLDQDFAKYSQMSLAAFDGSTNNVLYRGWVEVRSRSKQLQKVEFADASQSLKFLAYPNIVNWAETPIAEMTLNIKQNLATPAVFSSTAVKISGGLTKIEFADSAILAQGQEDLSLEFLDDQGKVLSKLSL